MKRIGTILLGVSILIIALAALNYAQFFPFNVIRNNTPPATELVIARWRFGTNGNIGHMGWSHNYPDAEMHLAAMRQFEQESGEVAAALLARIEREERDLYSLYH